MLDYGKQEIILGAIVDIIAAMNPNIEEVKIKRDKETREFNILVKLEKCPECDDE